ncbi:MAG TPA: mismatch-specific DNA-glycosylase [Kofleriaceae bacterium]|nr:mismatch-specific DNA-glycosylase [Kofleriaceae bacterium]
MARPRDVVMQRPTILFVGINPGETSGKVGHHFAGPGNPFWKLLHAAGITPIELPAAEDQRLVEFQHALVNLCTRPTKTASELTSAELARGARRLVATVRELEPEVVALVGVTLYPIVCKQLGIPKAQQTPGPGPKPELVGGARLFVVPNPSGLNASFPSFDAKLPWFRQLALYAGLGKPSPTSA